MNQGNEGMKKNLADLATALATLLWAVHRNDPEGPRLLMPMKRDSSTRVSEQESKILLCGLLEKTNWYYSIETPTQQTYVQKGRTPLSARCDVSLYKSQDSARRVANVELKAHNCTDENIRKDIEKLLREGIPALWFHTLAAADRGTFESLYEKFRKAFRTEQKHLGGLSHFIVFAICVLDSPRTIEMTLKLDGSAADVLGRVDQMFAMSSASPATVDAQRIAAPGSVADATAAPKGSRRDSEIVFCPAIDPTTWLHLSIVGTSYKLRRFYGTNRKPFIAPGARTVEELRAKYTFTHAISTTVEDRRHNVDKDLTYWEQRISDLNRENGLG